MTAVPTVAVPTTGAKKSKADRFREAANKRVQKAVEAIDAVGKLANPARYKWTDEQVNRVLSVLANHVEAVAPRFDRPTVSGNEPGFDVDDESHD